MQVGYVSEVFKVYTLVQEVSFPKSYLKKIDDDNDSMA